MTGGGARSFGCAGFARSAQDDRRKRFRVYARAIKIAPTGALPGMTETRRPLDYNGYSAS